MGRVLEFYKTQIRLIWEWKGGPTALIKRGLITFVVAVISFAITAAIIPGFTITGLIYALIAVLLVALFNALVRPILLALVAPHSLILTAVLVLILQVAAFYVIAQFSPGVRIDSVAWAIVASFVYAFVNTALTGVLGVDSGGSYYGSLVQGLRAKRAAPSSPQPGVVIIQIDGLAHPILAARIRAGSVNTMAGWLRNKTHRLARWEALLPSMTSAGQLGILHGNNDGIPAFRWYERDRQKLMVSSNPKDAAEIVARASNGEGILSNDGVSICNLVTGDAERSYLTTAALSEGAKGLGDSNAFYGFFLSPSGYTHSVTLFLAEFIKERYQARRTRRSGITPQMHRGLKYAGMRAASNVLLRDINVSLIIEEMYRGANVIYADFTDYDEIAHHSGPERVEALQALDGIDTALALLVKAAEDTSRPYKFVVLSDHGQSLGSTFKQRYGESLGEHIRKLMGGRAAVIQSTTAAEGSTFVNAFLSEVTRGHGAGPTVARAALASRTTEEGVVNLDAHDAAKDAAQVAAAEEMAAENSIVVVGSGNLGLVYFTGTDHRLTLEELEQIHPELVSSLVAHPGVGMLLVRSATRGGIVFGKAGAVYLDDGRVEGEDPMAPFGPHTMLSMRREDEMTHAPDLLLISQYDPDLGEVAAFEELIGSHGGLGGPQNHPFILYPADWELDEEEPVGAPAIYRNLRRWIESVGIRLGKPAGGGQPAQPPTEPRPETAAPVGA
jgi:uncharacterized membrane protein YvlD (DUF360 family)